MKIILFIAPLETHATVGRLAALASTGYELNVIDISSNSLRFNLNQYPFNEIASYKRLDTVSESNSYFKAFDKVIERLRCFGLIPQSRNVLRFLTKEIDRVKPSVVITYYGPLGIYFARLVKTINYKIPVISILNLIPSSLDSKNTIPGFFLNKLNSELKNYRHTLKKLDFVICASSEMKEFVSVEYGVSDDRMAVVPDYFPKMMTNKYPIDFVEQRNLSLVFLGAPERWGGTLDNIDEQFSAIARSGVSIHSGKLAESVVSTGNAFCYPFFQDEEVFSGCLSTFAHQFHASILTYGINKRHQRFTTTLPTRFFMSLSAGLPLVVRAGLFDAVESYVERYSIGFSYQTVEELKQKLLDKRQMAIFRQNAIHHSKEYFAEAQAKELKSIFEFVITNQRKF